MGGQKNLHHRKTARQESAKERAAARAALTNQAQLERLDSMFGEGVGAKKERARLEKIIIDVAKKKTTARINSKGKKKAAAKKEE